MNSSWTRIEPRPRRMAAAAVCLVLGWLMLPAPLAFAQDAAPPPPAAAPEPAPVAPPKQSGVFEAIGRWFDEGASNFRDHLRGAKRKMDDLNDDAAANSKGFSDNAAKVGQGAADATKNAMDAVAKLPTARLMNGRERCANAPNGAPDCVTAAEALCRKHGYSSGKSMDFTSAEECPVKTVLGQTNECTTVTFISRAMCQ